MEASERLSDSRILILDDDVPRGRLIGTFLKSRFNAITKFVRFPSQAVELASDKFFDFVIMDVTISEHGNLYGGIEAYEKLLPRYGEASLLVYSGYISDSLIRQFPYSYNFISRVDDFSAFQDLLIENLSEMRARQTCFIAMPFAKEYQENYDAIGPAIQKAGYIPIRIDRESFTESILDKMFSEILRCKLMLFLTDGKNPNVFYEAGYAHALRKEIVTVARSVHGMPFDIRTRNAIFHNDDLEDLAEKLTDAIHRLSRW
ncbi:MAG: response regulator [Verrucomicrobiae bacterium]|nr:response regulator [Verrucomicrobiae bacterium]